ncbi:hypothetical protein D5086_018437, partial [Populus alba]
NNLKSVKQLYLKQCNFTGSSLPRLGNLTQLTVLDISYNNLSGHIPFSIGKLKHLQTLNLGFNNFTGSVPSDFEQLTELVSLDLSGNSYLTLDSSSLNKLVQNLTKLRKLLLRWVNMSLVVPNSLKNFPSSLSILSFGNCGLRGEFPANIFLLPNLEFLNLGGNVGLTGSFPSSNLIELDLAFNNLSGRIPSSLANLVNLNLLDLSSNNFK